MTRRTAAVLAMAGVLLAGAGARGQTASWRHFATQEGTEGLAGDEIQFVKPATGGGVWIGTMTGLSRAKDGVFSVVAGPDGQPLKIAVWDLLETADGEVLVGHGGGVAVLGPTQGAAGGAPKAGKVNGGGTAAPLVRFAGGVWAIFKTAGVGRVVARGADGAWTAVEALKGVRAEDMTVLADGSLWVMADGDGVYELSATADASARKHHLQGVNVTAVFQDSRKRVWCALWGGGLMVLEGETWTQHLAKERAAMLSVAETPDGTVWAASSATGVWLYDGKAWRNLLRDEGAVNVLAVTAEGHVWISSQQTGGLRYWDGADWQTAIAGPLPVRSLLEAPDGTLWAGGVLDGVRVYQ